MVSLIKKNWQVYVILFFSGFLLAASITLAHCQTIPPPSTPCMNGRPWVYQPTNKVTPYVCQPTPACDHVCTYNTAAPAGRKCVNDFRKDGFVQGVIGSGKPVAYSVDDPDLYHVFIYGPAHTWDATAQKAADGLSCWYQIRRYFGEWPLGDPRNLIPIKPVVTPATQTLQTELLPLK